MENINAIVNFTNGETTRKVITEKLNESLKDTEKITLATPVLKSNSKKTPTDDISKDISMTTHPYKDITYELQERTLGDSITEDVIVTANILKSAGGLTQNRSQEETSKTSSTDAVKTLETFSNKLQDEFSDSKDISLTTENKITNVENFFEENNDFLKFSKTFQVDGWENILRNPYQNKKQFKIVIENYLKKMLQVSHLNMFIFLVILFPKLILGFLS